MKRQLYIANLKEELRPLRYQLSQTIKQYCLTGTTGAYWESTLTGTIKAYRTMAIKYFSQHSIPPQLWQLKNLKCATSRPDRYHLRDFTGAYLLAARSLHPEEGHPLNHQVKQ